MVETPTARQTMSWTIEPLPTDQLEALAAFQQRAYADQFNARFFVERDAVLRRLEWQHLSCPGAQPNRLPVWVLRRGQTIIGQLVVTPVPVKLGSQWLRGGWCQDFIVAPEYRRRGAGVVLVRETLRAIASEMSVVLAGGTNQHSYPVFRATGFQDLGVLPRYVGLMWLTRLLSLGVRDKRIVIERCDGVDERFDRFWRAREPSYTALVRRDQTWLRWRFWQHPHWGYSTWASSHAGELTGYVVARIGSTVVRGSAIRTCRIVEMVGESSVVAALLTHVVRFGAQHRCHVVRCDLLDSVLGPRVLTHHGIWAVPSSNRILVNILDPAIGLEIKPLEGWFLSAADSDFDLYEPE